MLGRLFGEFFVFFCLILSIFVLFMFNCVDICFVCFRFSVYVFEVFHMCIVEILCCIGWLKCFEA